MKPTKFASKTTPWRVWVPAKLSDSGKREVKYFETNTAARDFVAGFKERKAETGKLGVSADDMHYLHIIKNAIPDLKLIPEIIEHWKRTGANVTHKTTVRTAVIEFIAACESSQRGKRTLSDFRYRLNAFSAIHGDRQMHEVTPVIVQKFLDAQTYGWQRQSFFKRVKPFFKWGRLNRMLIENPMDFVERPETPYSAPTIYEIDDMESVLKACDAGYQRLVPVVVGMSFGFMRQSELVKMYSGESVLQWEDIKWDRGFIHLRHGVAKSTRRTAGDERFIPINDAFKHWLEPYKKDSGPVVDMAHNLYYDLMREMFVKAEVESVDNGFRHSALSYWFAANPKSGAGEVARLAGNSEAVAKKHYIKMLTEDLGKEYWDLRRDA